MPPPGSRMTDPALGREEKPLASRMEATLTLLRLAMEARESPFFTRYSFHPA